MALNFESIEDNENEQSRTLFVANLDERVNEKLLYEVFLQAGPLEKVNIPKNRSYGFVVYRQQCSVPYAFQLLDGVQLFRKRLLIKPKSNGSNMGMVQNVGYNLDNYNGAFITNLAATMLEYNALRRTELPTDRHRDYRRNADTRRNHPYSKNRNRSHR